MTYVRVKLIRKALGDLLLAAMCVVLHCFARLSHLHSGGGDCKVNITFILIIIFDLFLESML